MDFGRTYRGRRVFGSHKTWRGIVVGILIAIFIVWLQQQIANSYQLAFLEGRNDYLSGSAAILGFLFGFGALMGDALKSFAKRQLNINPGKPWFPFDQLDYIVGGCLATSIVTRLMPVEYLSILVVWFVVHLVFSYIGYILKLKATPI